jgi:hypothetical protein
MSASIRSELSMCWIKQISCEKVKETWEVAMEWIVFDYAGVISHAPPEEAGALLPPAAGVEPARFWPV